MASYPRVYVKERTHARVKRAAKKLGVDMKDIGDKIVLAGLRSLDF